MFTSGYVTRKKIKCSSFQLGHPVKCNKQLFCFTLEESCRAWTVVGDEVREAAHRVNEKRKKNLHDRYVSHMPWTLNSHNNNKN